MIPLSPPGVRGDPGGRFDGRIAANALWLFVAQITTLAAGLLVVVTVTRVLGPVDLGRWRFAQAVAAVLLVLADAGLTGLAIREIARRPDEIAEYARPVLEVRMVLSALLLVALGAVLIIAATDQASAVVTMLVAIGLVPAAFSTTYLFQAREAMGRVSLLRSVGQIAAAIFAIVGTIALGTILAPIASFLVASFGVSALTLGWAVRAHYLRSGEERGGLVARLLRPAAPFLLAALAVQVIFNADAFIIRALRGDGELGLYAAPYSIAGYALVLGGAVIGAAYPQIAAHSHSSLTIAPLVNDLSAVMGVLALPISIGTILVADLLVVALFGEAYAGTGPTLAILMTLPLVGFLNMTLGQALTARGLAGQVAAVAIVAATLNVALNLALVPTLGGFGAAVVVAITEVSTVVLYLGMLWRSDRSFPVPDYLSCLPASLVMAVSLVIARQLMAVSLPVLVALGIASFLAGIVIFPSRGIAILISLAPRRRADPESEDDRRA